MPAVFDGDLTAAVFWGADLGGARFRDVDLTGVRISHARVVDVEIDALVDRLVVNGVDVTAFVEERDRWYPLRTVLDASDPERMRAGWAALVEAWSALVARARHLPAEALLASVAGEWSFVQTLRHLLYAMDKWFTAPVLGGPIDPIGLPDGSGQGPTDLLGDAGPSLADVLARRADQARRFGDHLATLDADGLTRNVDVIDGGPHPVRECIATVLEEEFWHLRYAERDLTVLEAGR